MFFAALLLPAFAAQFAQGGFRSPAERVRFGDYLFCKGDYARAADEYTNGGDADSVIARAVLCSLELGEYDAALASAARISSEELRLALGERRFFILARERRYGPLRKELPEAPAEAENRHLAALAAFSKAMLYEPVAYEDFPLPSSAADSLRFYLRARANTKLKSPVLAAALSLAVPGLGKIYTGDTGDGVTGFILTTLLGYATYANIANGHTTRAVVSGAACAFFWSGAVYGSYAAAHIHNTEALARADNRLVSYFERNNYFLPERNILPCPR